MIDCCILFGIPLESIVDVGLQNLLDANGLQARERGFNRATPTVIQGLKRSSQSHPKTVPCIRQAGVLMTYFNLDILGKLSIKIRYY